MTNNDLKRDRAVMMSSTRPSTKYSCSGSPLMFWKGKTAMDGLSGKGSGVAENCGAPVAAPVPSEVTDCCQSSGCHFTLKLRTGRFDILQHEVAKILKGGCRSSGNGIADVARNQDAAF